ncbi:MAG: 4Fe-4S binding protein [Clostridia bacterium]|nr:4Fe-4S binding protein [Clostridia bacterium]
MDNKITTEALGITPKNGKLTSEQITKVKSYGCLRDKRFDDVFNVRVITRNGRISSDEQRAIAEAADRFGSSEVAMTSRLTVEIQGVPYDNIAPLMVFLASHGLETGGTGAKVRPVVACKGTTCVFGLIDTAGLSLKIHERFYKGYHDTALPHKFKIAVGGCPNNCVKPDTNDIGVIGQRVVKLSPELCRGCKKCVIETTCPMKAAKLTDGKICVDYSMCNRCGRCFEKCPFGVFGEAEVAYKLCIGGRWGKKCAVAKPLSVLFSSEEEVLDAIERAILFFRDEGVKGERFADTVERLGFDYAQRKILDR